MDKSQPGDFVLIQIEDESTEAVIFLFEYVARDIMPKRSVNT